MRSVTSTVVAGTATRVSSARQASATEPPWPRTDSGANWLSGSRGSSASRLAPVVISRTRGSTSASMPSPSRSLSQTCANSRHSVDSADRRSAGSTRSRASAFQISATPMAALTAKRCRWAYDQASASGSTVSIQ